MAAKKEKLSSLSEQVWGQFIAICGWGGTAEERQEELEAIDNKIKSHLDQIELLKTQKGEFDKREQVAKDFLVQAEGLFGPTATEATLLSALKARFGVRAKRGGGGGGRVGISAEDQQKVIDVLDAEGMFFGEIQKATGVESKHLSKVLKSLIEGEKIGSEGERRAKRYFLFAEDEESETEDD